MNPTSKKFISLFLVFSLMMLSANLYAKERRGAKLIITKKDGQLIEGELITVKENSLLVLDTEGKDVSIDIGDIKVIEKKSQIGKGVLYGTLIIGGGGTLLGGILGSGYRDIGFSGGALVGALYFIPSGLLIGILIGSAAGLGKKTIQIEGMSDLEIREALDKLRKKARIRDYK